ncbi:MAG: polysaccharide biosynthesis protein [Catenulispora sp.]|nr:polysaccharide biosynthesis protein [Catenulispora sp.]
MRTLIVGAGQAGRSLARDLRRVEDFGLVPVGFVDDALEKQGGIDLESRLPVLGTLPELPRLVAETRAEAVVLAIPGLPAARVRELTAAATGAAATVRYLPSFVAALQRDVVGSDLRALDVKALIGRPELHVVSPEVKEIVAGKRVLVTGAGGSIGSELCRQVYAFNPSALYLLDHDESNLHRLQLEIWGEALLSDASNSDLLIADIRDRHRMEQIFRDLRPEVVFHAAAHKHLPLLERHPSEGVKSNARGTDNLVHAATRYGAERFILISTDKAADPTSVLGASKRLAEIIVQGAAHEARTQGTETVFAAVRFGNVLGSRGSLLTVLAEQIRAGGPVTITHPDATRFFMTIEEAVGLVLEAGRLAAGGEIFVLDMGEPVRIVDLVPRFTHQYHLPEVPIRFTGLRQGEKLDETLFSGKEERVPTGQPRIFSTVSQVDPEEFATLPARLDRLYRAAKKNRDPKVRQELARLLPDYTPALQQPTVLARDRGDLASPYPDGY